MSNYTKIYEQLYKILDKEKISIKELRELTNNELVTAISPSKSDKILYHKYDVRLENGELYYVFLKKSIFEILTLASNREI